MSKKHVNSNGAWASGFIVCPKCMESKPLSDFAKNKSKKSGINGHCTLCMRQYLKERYSQADSLGKRRNAKAMKFKKELKKILVDLLGSKCARCGYDRCLSALEFHHTEGNKEKGLAVLLTSAAWGNDEKLETARTEAVKCILLCANCHRELHDQEDSHVLLQTN